MWAEDWRKILGRAATAGMDDRLKSKKSPAIQRGTLVKDPITVKDSYLLDVGCSVQIGAHALRHPSETAGLHRSLERSIRSQTCKRVGPHQLLEGLRREKAAERLISRQAGEGLIVHKAIK